MTEEEFLDILGLVAGFSEFLNKHGAHYRIVVVDPEGKSAWGNTTLSPRDSFTDVCNCIYNLVKDSGRTREEVMDDINAEVDEIEERLKEDKNGNKSE